MQQVKVSFQGACGCIVPYPIAKGALPLNELTSNLTTVWNLWYKTLSRAVASMSGEDVGKKFPNDKKNFQIFHGIQSHKGVCYPENEDTINYKY
jgi:hypothetical protein